MAGLAGYMPAPGLGAIYGGDFTPNWGDVMNTLVASEQANARQNYGNSPMGNDFLRRFTGSSPLGLPAQENPVAAPTPDFAALQGALAQAARESGQFIPNAVTRQTGVPYAGPMIDASEGPLRGQPWYDELIAAAQANPGASMPMVMGSGGTPRDMDKANAYRANRAAEMKSRRSMGEQQAVAKAEQRASRMGDLSPNQQYFNELGRLQGALGGEQQGGGGNLMNIVMGGPEFAAAMDRNNVERQNTRDKLDFAASPAGWVAGALSNGMPVPDVYSGQRAIADPMGFALGQIASKSPDRDTFLNNAAALGFSPEEAAQAAEKYFPTQREKDWTEWAFGSDRKAWGIPTPWTDPNRSAARGFIGNWLADALGIE